MKVLPPLTTAGTRTKALLFAPFDAGKWFILGFSAWLAGFLTGTNPGFNLNIPGEWGSGRSGGSTLPSLPHLDTTAVVLIVVAAVIVFAALFLVFLWLGCRGCFMLLDNVLRDRAEIAAPWKQFRPHANSLLGFYLALTGVMILGFAVFAVPGWFLYPHHLARPEWPDLAPLLPVFALFLVFVIALSLISFLTLDFGTLWMYRHGGSVWAATLVVLRLASEHPLPFIAYIVVRFFMTIAIVVAGTLLGCLTCCLGFLPYLNAVLTLPLSVYRVWYSVECFAQLGPDCDPRVVPGPSFLPPPPVPPIL